MNAMLRYIIITFVNSIVVLLSTIGLTCSAQDILFKYDSCGNRIRREPAERTEWQMQPLTKSRVLHEPRLTVNPNPTTVEACIEFTNHESHISNANLYSLDGKYIKSVTITDGRGYVDVSELSDGLYLIQVIDSEMNIHTVKLVKE